MPEFSFEVEKPNGSKTEYRTRGNGLSAAEAVERTYKRYPEGQITRQLYGTPVPDDVSLDNPNTGSDDETDDADSEATGVTQEAETDESEDAEDADTSDDSEAETDESDADEATDDEAEVADDESMVPPPIDPAAFTVSEMRSELADRDMSPAQLRGLKVSEEGGEGRVTVIRAIDDRLNSDDE